MHLFFEYLKILAFSDYGPDLLANENIAYLLAALKIADGSSLLQCVQFNIDPLNLPKAEQISVGSPTGAGKLPTTQTQLVTWRFQVVFEFLQQMKNNVPWGPSCSYNVFLWNFK